MIKGIGIDIVELDRISEAIKKNNRFTARVLTEEECKQYRQIATNHRKIEFVAGRFAAKEAFAKANGTGIGKLSFQHINILSGEGGKPIVHAKGFEADHILVSISHSKAYAVAQVIITDKNVSCP